MARDAIRRTSWVIAEGCIPIGSHGPEPANAFLSTIAYPAE
jgi:hypothetical protein